MFQEVLKETWKKKSLARILLNQAVQSKIGKLTGHVLDVGGGGNPSYQRYLDLTEATLETLNLDPKRQPTYFHDLNKPLPVASNHYQSVLCFNTLYCVRDQQALVNEMYRTLKPGGTLFLINPFIFNEQPEPEDYSRLTRQGLAQLMQMAGFQNWQIQAIGGRVAAAETLIDDALLIYPFRLIARFIALGMDKYLFSKLDAKHPAPQAFLVIAQKA